MDVIFHVGEESNRFLQDFIEKRVSFSSEELQNLGMEKLTALLRAFQEDNRTFERKDPNLYN